MLYSQTFHSSPAGIGGGGVRKYAYDDVVKQMTDWLSPHHETMNILHMDVRVEELSAHGVVFFSMKPTPATEPDHAPPAHE